MAPVNAVGSIEVPKGKRADKSRSIVVGAYFTAAGVVLVSVIGFQFEGFAYVATKDRTNLDEPSSERLIFRVALFSAKIQFAI